MNQNNEDRTVEKILSGFSSINDLLESYSPNKRQLESAVMHDEQDKVDTLLRFGGLDSSDVIDVALNHTDDLKNNKSVYMIWEHLKKTSRLPYIKELASYVYQTYPVDWFGIFDKAFRMDDEDLWSLLAENFSAREAFLSMEIREPRFMGLMDEFSDIYSRVSLRMS